MKAERGYPRPQLARSGWIPLNGPWEFAFDSELRWREPGAVSFDRAIQVPFAPEAPLSGIGETGFIAACWYRRQFECPPLADGRRLWLHFGAVDYRATVWVDGELAGGHEGGFTPFSIDISGFLRSSAAHTLAVRAEDDPHDLTKPRGKQDWLREPHSIWYPRTTGIWQTVWLEVTPACRIAEILWTPSLEYWELGCEVRVDGEISEQMSLQVSLQVGETPMAQDSYRLTTPEVARRIALSDPGIDDYRNEFLWSPSSPRLFDAQFELRDRSGNLIDRVRSYTALRSAAVQGEYFMLNGRPLPLRMVLDQGYWPEGGLTAPSDAALRRDVELAKAMGFNGVRKHQKLEDPRYLYWADHLGLLVWTEMPSAYRFTRVAIERSSAQWVEAIRRDASHPCVIAWVPFNESWGVPNLPHIPEERHFVQALYHLTRALDRTRPVIGNDGWESVATDIIGIHDYDHDPDRLLRRYAGSEVIPHLFRRERPGGRLLTLEGHPHAGQPLMLTEFGGIAFGSEQPAAWGYSRVHTAEEFAQRYTRLLAAVHSVSAFCGFCYTQFADTYQEVNGLLYADRRPKIPMAKIRAATLGPPKTHEDESDRRWRECVLYEQRARESASSGLPEGEAPERERE